MYYDPETDTNYVIHRILEPENGRWLSFDPLWMTDGKYIYVYAQNNPLLFIDPFGLYPEMLEFCTIKDYEDCIKPLKNSNPTTIRLLEIIKERECPDHEIKCCGKSTNLSESPCDKCGEGRVRVGNVEQVTRPFGGARFEQQTGKFLIYLCAVHIA